MQNVTAKDILLALENKHFDDVFVPECKGGPTWAGRHSRLDAWAMPRSWVRWTTYGYEIKVSRSDFVQDEKWVRYLDLCHQLYFVCPWGMIRVEEAPEAAGLMWLTNTGSRLVIKKKAPRREIAFPQDLFIYLLMSRLDLRLKNEHLDARDGDVDARARRIFYHRQQVENAKNGQDVAALVRGRVRREIMDLHQKAVTAEQEVRGLQEFADLMGEMKINPQQLLTSWGKARVENDLRDKIAGVSERTAKQIEDAAANLARLARDLRKIGSEQQA